MPPINESDLFPIKSVDGNISLELYDYGELTTDTIVVRLVIWEDDTEHNRKELRDVKEQWVNIPVIADENWDFLHALKRVLTDVLSTYRDIERLLPADLFKPAWSALTLKNRDFDKSLRAKSRLGKFLPS